MKIDFIDWKTLVNEVLQEEEKYSTNLVKITQVLINTCV